MLRARLATAAVAIPLLLALILFGPNWLFALVVGGLGIGGVIEYATMAFSTRPGEKILTIVLGFLTLLGVILTDVGALGDVRALAAAIAVMTAAGLIWTLLARPDFEQGLADLGLAQIGILYAGFLTPHFIWLRNLPPDGPLLVLFVLGVGMAGDTGGYFIGHAFGRHKLMPRVSPGKTVEGAIGITVSSLLGASVCKFAFAAAGTTFMPELGWPGVLTLALIMAVLGQLGDLSESVMKRTFQSKESGWLFPGHGGVLDRLDSLLFPLVVLYYYLAMLR